MVQPEPRRSAATCSRVAAELSAGRITLLAGCSALTPQESIAYARAAKEAGCDGILLTPPPYVVPNDRELVAFYGAVSDAVEIPICVYNWPRGTGVDLSPSSARPARRASTTSSRSRTRPATRARSRNALRAPRARAHLRRSGERARRRCSSSTPAPTARSAQAPCSAPITPTSSTTSGPGERRAGARSAGRATGVFFESCWSPDFSPRFGSQFAILKAALDLRGLPGGHVRPPLLPLSEEERGRVRTSSTARHRRLHRWSPSTRRRRRRLARVRHRLLPLACRRPRRPARARRAEPRGVGPKRGQPPLPARVPHDRDGDRIAEQFALSLPLCLDAQRRWAALEEELGETRRRPSRGRADGRRDANRRSRC